MARRIGNVRKRFLTRERLIQIAIYLQRPDKRRGWSNAMRHKWEEFNSDWENSIDRLYYELRYQVFKPGPFIIFDKKERNKVRRIYASNPVEQIVDNLLFDCLEYVYVRRKEIIPETSYGSIVGKANVGGPGVLGGFGLFADRRTVL